MDAEARSEVNARKLRLLEQLSPSTDLGEILVERIAVLSVRLERSVRVDEAATSRRVREAPEAVEKARAASIDHDAYALAGFHGGRCSTRTLEPGTTPKLLFRRLTGSVDGIDALIGRWYWLRGKVEGCTPGQSAPGSYGPTVDAEAFDYLRGVEPSERSPSAIAQVARRVNRGEHSAKAELLAAVDEVIARIEAMKDRVDPSALDRERREAEELALFDRSKEGELHRKYEARTERALFRALAELRIAERPREADHVDGAEPASRKPKAATPRPNLSIATPTRRRSPTCRPRPHPSRPNPRSRRTSGRRSTTTTACKRSGPA